LYIITQPEEVWGRGGPLALIFDIVIADSETHNVSV
jgi:hypothetical protein